MCDKIETKKKLLKIPLLLINSGREIGKKKAEIKIFVLGIINYTF